MARFSQAHHPNLLILISQFFAGEAITVNGSSYNTQSLVEMFHSYFGWNRVRIHCIVALILGIIQLGTVNFTKIACAFPGKALSDSSYKRLQRLFRYFNLDFDKMSQFIACLTELDQWKLTLDRTNLKFGTFNVNDLTLGIAHTKIAFQPFWTCLKKKEIQIPKKER